MQHPSLCSRAGSMQGPCYAEEAAVTLNEVKGPCCMEEGDGFFADAQNDRGSGWCATREGRARTTWSLG